MCTLKYTTNLQHLFVHSKHHFQVRSPNIQKYLLLFQESYTLNKLDKGIVKPSKQKHNTKTLSSLEKIRCKLFLIIFFCSLSFYFSFAFYAIFHKLSIILLKFHPTTTNTKDLGYILKTILKSKLSMLVTMASSFIEVER